MAADDIKYTPAKVKDPIAKSKHKLKRVSGAANTTPVKMRIQADGLRRSASNKGGAAVGGGT